MAGEWIPVDCNIATKPEVLELVDLTGEPVETVVFRLLALWSWASLNTADGRLRGTPRRLAAVAGGDEGFWLAVETVGWVAFSDGELEIIGWEKRFSRAAKARAHGALRACAFRARKALPEERRGEEKREEEIPAAPVPTSRPRTAASPDPKVAWDSESGWTGISDKDRREWSEAFPGAVIDLELAKATAWLRANPTKAGRRNWRRFVVGWLQRCQDRGGSSREPGMRPGDRPAVVRVARPDLGGQAMSDEEYSREKRRLAQQARLRAEREQARRERLDDLAAGVPSPAHTEGER